MPISEPISDALNALDDFFWLDGVSASLAGLYRQYGKPAPPVNTFGRVLRVLPFLRSGDIQDLAEYGTLAVDAYNDGVKAAYRCLGWKYVGVLSALVNETKGTEAWHLYCKAAQDFLDEYFGKGAALADFDTYLLEPAQDYLSQSKRNKFPE